MTIGEWVRSSGDEELATLLINWMLTIIMTAGLDFTKLDIRNEFYELLSVLKSPVTDEMQETLELLKSDSPQGPLN